MASRSWLEKYLAYSAGSEAPEMFNMWCGISTVSAVLGRRVMIDMKLYTVYPNLIIILVAGSGRCRKSASIDLASGIVREMQDPPKIISQKITPEALIQMLEGKKDEDSTGWAVVDELSTFLNRRSYEAGLAEVIIPTYDCRDPFEYRTKTKGVNIIRRPCFSMLGGSTIEWLKSAIPEEAIGSGLTSRMLFVYETKPSKLCAFPKAVEDVGSAVTNMQEHLERIACRTGEIVITPKGREFFEAEYLRFAKGSSMYSDKYLMGYASRRHVHMLKIAMVVSMSESKEMTVDDHHLDVAKGMLETSESTLGMLFRKLTSTEVGGVTEWVRGKISRGGGDGITRVKLMQNVSHKLTARELDEVLETLTRAGQVETFHKTGTARVVYRIKGG